MSALSSRLDEIKIRCGKEFDERAVLYALRRLFHEHPEFDTLVVEIWEPPPKKEEPPCSNSPTKMVELFSGYSQPM